MQTAPTTMQSLPDSIEASDALVPANFAECDAAVIGRDTLLAENDRLRHLLLKLFRMRFSGCGSLPGLSGCHRSNGNSAWRHWMRLRRGTSLIRITEFS